MIYGYARVSTDGQAKDGNSLEVQERTLRENGAETIYRDAFTGTKRHRPEFDRLMEQLGAGDTLIVTKLDRMARSTTQGIEIVSELLDRGIRVNVLNIGMMDNSPNGKLIRTIFFAFAEFERDMIVERTREGKEIARNNPDYRDGRKKIEVPRFGEFYQSVLAGEKSVEQAVKELGITRSKWYRLIKECA